MFHLSHTTGYAILALAIVCDGNGRWVMASEIAAQARIPKPYLLKILHSLTRSGIIQAKRGYRGGFCLAQPAGEISLLRIAKAVEGEKILTSCLLGLDECSDARACPSHEFWKVERQRIVELLQRITLAETAAFERIRQSRSDCGKGARVS